MNNPILRGYAVPFNSLTLVRGVMEVVKRGAFSAMLADASWPVRLQYDSHDDGALVLANNLTLFEDEYGLGFEAELDANNRSTWIALSAIVRGRHFGASVNFADMETYEDVFGNVRAQHVDQAFIDHVCVTDSPAYRTTCVWRADCDLGDAPYAVRQAAERWDAGYEKAFASSSAIDDAELNDEVENERRYEELLRLTAKSRNAAKAMFRAAFRSDNQPESRPPDFTEMDDLALVSALFKKQGQQISDLRARLAELESKAT